MSRFCGQCGKKVEEDDRFCDQCGNPVRPPDAGRKQTGRDMEKSGISTGTDISQGTEVLIRKKDGIEPETEVARHPPPPPQSINQIKDLPKHQNPKKTEAPAGSTRKTVKTGRIVILALFALALVFGAWQVERKDTVDPEQQLSLGERYLQELQYEEAVLAFTKVIEVEPRNEQAYLGLAEAFLGLGEMGQAIEALEEGLAQTGSDTIRSRLEELLISRNVELGAAREATDGSRNGEDIAGSDRTEMPVEVRPFQYEDLTFHVFKPIQIEEEVRSLLGEPLEMVNLGINEMAGVNVRSLVYDDVTIETLAYGTDEFPVERIHIQERLILGPRNIRVGDSLESVLALFPDDGNEMESVWGDTYRRFLYGNEDDFYYYDGRYDNFAEVAYLTYDRQKEPTALHFLLVNGTSFFHEVALMIENRRVHEITVFHAIYY